MPGRDSGNRSSEPYKSPQAKMRYGDLCIVTVRTAGSRLQGAAFTPY